MHEICVEQVLHHVQLGTKPIVLLPSKSRTDLGGVHWEIPEIKDRSVQGHYYFSSSSILVPPFLEEGGNHVKGCGVNKSGICRRAL